MNSLLDFHFYDVCCMVICFSTARNGMDGWLMNHLLRETCLGAVTLQMGANQKICYYFIKRMTQAPSFQNYPLFSHNPLKFLSCCVGGRWISLCQSCVSEDAATGDNSDTSSLCQPCRRKGCRRLFEGQIQGFGMNWIEGFGTRARSRKAGNDGAGAWKKKKRRENKAERRWTTLGI